MERRGMEHIEDEAKSSEIPPVNISGALSIRSLRISRIHVTIL